MNVRKPRWTAESTCNFLAFLRRGTGPITLKYQDIRVFNPSSLGCIVTTPPLIPHVFRKTFAALALVSVLSWTSGAPLLGAAPAHASAVTAKADQKAKAKATPTKAKPSTGKATAKKTSAQKTTAKKAVASKTAKSSAKKAAAKSTAKTTAKATRTKARGRKTLRTGWRPSDATQAGLRETDYPLSLSSSVAYVLDQDTGEELVLKNADVALPIASVTKLMTALVIAESGLPLDEKIKISREDYVRSNASSKLKSGMVLTRTAVLQAALMSSDNRAAHALARTFPGGKKAFVREMNARAAELGMTDSVFADPTGLDNRNHSTARDLGKLVNAVYAYSEIREASTAPVAKLKAGKRWLNMQTTNRLIGDPSWRIGIQKTGFTTAAGRCMVVQSEVGERRLVMVVLDSPDNGRRAEDMKTMRAFVETEPRFNQNFPSVRPYELF